MRDFRELSPTSEQGPQIRLLIEIVSGIGLPVADLNATDPYVIVRLGGSKEVHRTIPIYGTYVLLLVHWDLRFSTVAQVYSHLMAICLLDFISLASIPFGPSPQGRSSF